MGNEILRLLVALDFSTSLPLVDPVICYTLTVKGYSETYRWCNVIVMNLSSQLIAGCRTQESVHAEEVPVDRDDIHTILHENSTGECRSALLRVGDFL